MGKETFWIRWQVLHSKVRSSKPRSPGEIRANPILCLQVGHDGRSALKMLITQHPEPTIRRGCEFWSVRLRTLSDKILAHFLGGHGTTLKNRNYFRRSRVDA
jgi:hypothetical protein